MYKICIEPLSSVRLTRGCASTRCVVAGKARRSVRERNSGPRRRTCVRPCSGEGGERRRARKGRLAAGGRQGGCRSGGEPRLEAPLIHEYIHRLRRNFDHAVNRIPCNARSDVIFILRKVFSRARPTRRGCVSTRFEKGTLDPWPPAQVAVSDSDSAGDRIETRAAVSVVSLKSVTIH